MTAHRPGWPERIGLCSQASSLDLPNPVLGTRQVVLVVETVNTDTLSDVSARGTGPLREQIEQVLREKYDITHVTVQFEFESCKGAGLMVNGRK